MEDTLSKLQDAFFKADAAVQNQRKNNFQDVNLSTLEGIRTGLKTAIDIYEDTERAYKVMKISNATGTRRTTGKNLTRNEAKAIVSQDIKNNPKGKSEILVFDRM